MLQWQRLILHRRKGMSMRGTEHDVKAASTAKTVSLLGSVCCLGSKRAVRPKSAG
jgi:hypothetical protein